jgi:hypothetical protein
MNAIAPGGFFASHSSILAVLGFLVSLLQLLLLSVFIPDSAQLKRLADRIYNRMQGLGLSGTQLSERCSLAALHLFENNIAPALTRDRIAKILMNRQDLPARSAARVITYPELKVLASVLQVSTEWLIGQSENRDPVVWNVLAQPDRFQSMANLIQHYEERSQQTTIWSRHPPYPLVTEDFSRAINQIHFTRKDGTGNRPLIEFYNTVARARRKWILRPNRPFTYVSIIFKDDLEQMITGRDNYSLISKTILARNLQFMIDTITNSAYNVRLIIGDERLLTDPLRNYDSVATTDEQFSFWNYHNGDIGWSEHAHYVDAHNRLLNDIIRQAPYAEPCETVAFLKSLKARS